MHAILPTTDPQVSPPSPAAGVRARVWIDSGALFRREEARHYCWLWLHRADGRVQALRLDARALNRDELIEPLLRAGDADPRGTLVDGQALGAALLPRAAVVPQSRWSHSWGHPLNEAIRAFADTLDTDVLRALGRLERQGQFFGTTTNYSRLATLPQPIRLHRLQALTTFPPLVAPLLLTVLPEPELFKPGEDEGNKPDDGPMAAAVLEAMDRGRDLSGALAAYWRVDRALIRSGLVREPWPSAERFGTALRLMQAIPAHSRPSSPAQVSTMFRVLMQLLGSALSQRDIERLGQAFSTGWTKTWLEAAQVHRGPHLGLQDARDFLRAALDQAHLPNPQLELSPERLALAWIARRGVSALIRASLRWHALPAVTQLPASHLPDTVEPLLGAYHENTARAIELTTRAAVVAEGLTMNHCVGDYWDDCVFGATRIWHLELDDGETATAEYALSELFAYTDDPEIAGAEPGMQTLNFDVELMQLKGPHNADPSGRMQMWAKQVAWVLNMENLRERRQVLVEAGRAAHERHADRSPRQTLRPLDLGLRRELAVVLDYCAQQPDWLIAPDTVYRGPLAGFRYGCGPQLLDQLQVGDPLRLVREPDNAHDPRAVRVDWRGRKLGYLPRAHNTTIAGRLDAGQALAGHILAIDPGENHWEPVAITIRATESQ